MGYVIKRKDMKDIRGLKRYKTKTSANKALMTYKENLGTRFKKLKLVVMKTPSRIKKKK